MGGGVVGGGEGGKVGNFEVEFVGEAGMEMGVSLVGKGCGMGWDYASAWSASNQFAAI